MPVNGSSIVMTLFKIGIVERMCRALQLHLEIVAAANYVSTLILDLLTKESCNSSSESLPVEDNHPSR